MISRLKTRQILLLLAIDALGSLRKAAERVGVAQPAATKLLHELERTLGVALFTRTRRGLRPTEYGEIMIRHARSVYADFDHARGEMVAVASGSTGRLRVGTVASAIPFLLARAVARLKQEQPRLTVEINVSTSDLLIPALNRGDLDLLIARPVLAEHPALDYEQLIDEPLAIVARRAHPLLDGRPLALGDLKGRPWTLFPWGTPMRQVLKPLFAEIGPVVNLVETTSIITILALLQASDTLAILPADTAQFCANCGLLSMVPIDLGPVMGSYGVITRRDRPDRAAITAFIGCLRAVLADSKWADTRCPVGPAPEPPARTASLDACSASRITIAGA
jgi:DNA-binding transcriptional LysR family regulator